MKNIKSIALSALIMIAASSFIPAAQAHPLETLMPFFTRIVLKSPSYLEAARGLWIKKLAEPYGLQCPYPVFVRKNKEPVSYAAFANADRIETGVQPKLDMLGRVILDISDKDLVQTKNNHIVFDYNCVKDNQNNRKYLAAVLHHEVKHLDEKHIEKGDSIYAQNQYAAQNGLGMALSNGTPVSPGHFYSVILPGLVLLYEEEADSAVKKYPDLCHALTPHSSCFKSDLEKFRSNQNILIRPRNIIRQKKRGPVKDKEVFNLYRKACSGDRNACEYLELTYQLSHPLEIRSRQYLLQWKDEAEKNQVKKHPNLNDAWLDYCTRHITRLKQPK